MSWYLGITCSALALCLSVVAAVSASRRGRKSGRYFKPFNILFGGVFISVLICLLPVYFRMFYGTHDRLFNTFFLSLHSTLQTFTINAEKDIILDNVVTGSAWLNAVYRSYLSVMYVAAPILTFGFLISFFGNMYSKIRFAAGYFREAYVFSELNEKSLTLGADLRSNHRKALIIYANVPDGDDGHASGLRERAKEIRALCFKKDITSLRLGLHSAKSRITMFAIGGNEQENISLSLKLIEKYSRRENTGLYVFSTGTGGEMLLAKADKGDIKVRRVDEARLLVYGFLYERGLSLFESASGPEGKKKISSVLVGLGKTGTEMLKALSWYCQMDGYDFSVDAFDFDDKALDRFAAAAPELISGGIGDTGYSIRIHSGIDTETGTFADEIGKLSDTTFVFVSLGSDEENIRTSAKMRMLFERMKIRPVIYSVISGTEEKKALENITNYRGQLYDITFIGDAETMYSENTIMESELEKDALKRHLKWGNEEEFWQYEYNYRSSVAASLHAKARVKLGIPGAGKSEDELTDDERDMLEKLEHRRWNAYMRSEGYIYSGSTDRSSRNDLAKTHNNLVGFSDLTEEDKRKDSRVGAG